ncbi:DNA primase [Corticicoccus populi]|uniref:DNA primase n=1 Tax=Corticicoccus populi TaxID=1812821 RepID=A0ABW5WT70_9STAP
MRVPDETVNKVKNGTDIVELVSSYVKLEKRGRNYVGLCPFHNEKTPSFSVSPDKQICHCFGCKKGGNVFQFLMEIESLNFSEAVKKLGEPLGVSITTEESRVDESDMTLIKMHEYLTDLYHHVLMHTNEGEEALKYLTDRGFSADIIKKEKIGITPNMRDFTKNALLNQNFSMESAYQAGLVSRNEENFSYYDRFVSRIMIPIKNHQNYIVGYTARSLDGSEPKYLNTPETPVFQKRELLFNLSDARKFIRKQDEIILMEGHLDVIKVKMTDVQNIVGLMGTALSGENINLIKRLASNVTLMFDSDNAGRKAATSVGETLLFEGLNVFIIQLPEGEDPDEYIEKHGREKFEQLVQKQKRHFVHFQADHLLDESMENDLSYTQNLNKLINYLKYVPGNTLKERIITHISDSYKVSKEHILSSIPSQTENVNYFEPPAEPQMKIALSTREKKERYFLKALSRDKSLFIQFKDEVSTEVLTSPTYYGIFKGLCTYYEKFEDYDVSMINQYVSEECFEALLDLDSIKIHDDVSKDELNDYLGDLSGIRNSTRDKQLIYLQLKEAEQSNDVDRQIELMQKLVEINSRHKK